MEDQLRARIQPINFWRGSRLFSLSVKVLMKQKVECCNAASEAEERQLVVFLPLTLAAGLNGS